MVDAVVAQGGTQRVGHLRLPDEFLEGFGSVTTIQSDCHPLRLPVTTPIRERREESEGGDSLMSDLELLVRRDDEDANRRRVRRNVPLGLCPNIVAR